MRSPFKTSLLTLTFLAAAVAACATEAGDENVDMSSDELQKTPIGIDPTGPIVVGPVDPLPPTPPSPIRKSPRVISRAGNGNSVTIKLDRALAADELPMNKVELLVMRRQGSTFVKKNIATGASLSADQASLNITLSEPVKAGEIYFPRGEWHPCASSTSGNACKPRPARFGELLVKSRRTTPFADAIATNVGVLAMDPDPGTGTGTGGGKAGTLGTKKVGTFGTAKAGLASEAVFKTAPLMVVAAPQTELVLVEDPPPPQGTFRVKSMTPANEATEVDRKTEKIIIDFEGGTIDCAKTGHGQNAFHLHSVSPDVYDQQSMYEDPQNSLPNSGGFRGSLRCEEDNNRIVFTTPGVLLGDAWFQIDLNAWSKEGNFMGNKVLEFKTKRPGLQVFATRVENHYGGDNTCDDDFFGTNYCDIYVTSAIATAGGGQPSRIPEQGDFGGMTFFPSDNNGGKRDLNPPRVLYANANPIDEVVDVQMWAVDADDDSTWKKVFEVAGKVAGAMATALTPIRPDAGAIAEGVSAGFLGLAEIIPTNEDDFLGSGRFIFTASGQRWGTQSVYPIELDLSKNSPNRGPVKVFLQTQELPLSWRLPGPIL